MTHELIGQKVKLKVTTTSRVYENLSPDPIVLTHYELDDPVMEEKIQSSFPGNCRIQLHGTIVTANFVPTRTNVYIDKEGIITEISKG